MTRGPGPGPLVVLAEGRDHARIAIYPGVTEVVGAPAESQRLLERLAGLTPDAWAALSWAPAWQLGADPLSYRRQRTYVPATAPLTDTDEAFTVRDWLKLAAALWGGTATGAIEAEQSRWGLQGVTRQRLGTLSPGWQQLVRLATSLVTQPRLWILDNPAQHLDHEGRLILEAVVAGRDAGWLPVATVVSVGVPLMLPNRWALRWTGHRWQAAEPSTPPGR